MSSKISNTGTTNRCERCNRPLKDPNAEYGWRCAEILGVTTDLNRSGDGAFDSYNAGVSEAMHYLRENNINQDSIDTKAFIEANIKRRIAEDLEDYRLYELAVEEMNNALKPAMMRMFNGETKTPTIPELLNRLDDHHYLNGNYTTNKYHDGSYNKEIYELQRMLNANGVRGRYWDKLSEDGILGAETLRGLESFGLPEWVLENKSEAAMNLHNIIDEQYVMEERDYTKIEAIDPIIGSILEPLKESRVSMSLNFINQNKDVIIAAESTFGVPREVIASVILKEQVTQSLPDWAAVPTTVIGDLTEKKQQFAKNAHVNYTLPGIIERKINNYFGNETNFTNPIWYLNEQITDNKYWKKIFGEHSTGPGAIFPNTAKDAWNWHHSNKNTDWPEDYYNTVEGLLKEDNLETQKALAADDKFNIYTIGAVLTYKAEELGFEHGTLMDLSDEDWKAILSSYNGKTIYGDMTAEYFPDMIKYLSYP